MTINLGRMLDGYVECMGWADCGPDHETHGHDFSPELHTKARADCERFIAVCGEPLLDALAELAPEYSDERFGHDFWLTRNGHGAGYWDRRELGTQLGMSSGPLGDLAESSGDSLGDTLTARCKGFRQVDLYLGDDGLVYGG